MRVRKESKAEHTATCGIQDTSDTNTSDGNESYLLHDLFHSVVKKAANLIADCNDTRAFPHFGR